MLKRQRMGEAMCTPVQREAVLGVWTACDPDAPPETWRCYRQILQEGFASIDRRLQEEAHAEMSEFFAHRINKQSINQAFTDSAFVVLGFSIPPPVMPPSTTCAADASPCAKPFGVCLILQQLAGETPGFLLLSLWQNPRFNYSATTGGSLRATSISCDRCGRSRFSRERDNTRRQPVRFQADPGICALRYLAVSFFNWLVPAQ